jgi:hypothetical protein
MKTMKVAPRTSTEHYRRAQVNASPEDAAMKRRCSAIVAIALVCAACGANESMIPSNPSGPMTFFVTSSRSATG